MSPSALSSGSQSGGLTSTSGWAISSAAPSIAPSGRSGTARASAGSATAITNGAPSAEGLLLTSTSAPAPSAPGRATVPPQAHTANAQTAVRQCIGRSSCTRAPGVTSASSASRLAALVTQLASTRPESSTRSASGPYQVSAGADCPLVQVSSKVSTGGVVVVTRPHYAVW